MRRLIILVFIVAGLIGAAIAAAPFIAATDLAKQRIAAQIEGWTGRPVTFAGEPQVKLFPFLSLTIEDATIGDASGTSDQPFVVMDILTCKLRLLPFLIGRVDVAEFQLVRPQLRLSVDADGRKNWDMMNGSVATEATEEQTSHASGNPDGVSHTKLGRFKIMDGTVTFDDARNGRHEILSAVSINLSWPEIANAISGSGEFTWRGEVVEFNNSISDPLKLIAGDPSALRFAIASKPLRASFVGTAHSLADLQLAGTTTVTTPSVRRVAEWFGVEMAKASTLGAGRIDGELDWIGSSLSFSDAQIELDGNSAEGALSVSFADQRPRLQGTLAVEDLDLTAYLETIQASVTANGPWRLSPITIPILGAVDADIRLSANKILLGSAEFGTSAASLTVTDDQMTVSIGEAEFYGGSLEAYAEAQLSDGAVTASADISVENTSAKKVLTNLAGMSFFDGQASTTANLSGHGETWGALAESLTGTASLDVADGMLVGIELGEMAGLSGGFGVTDSAAGTGTVRFSLLAGTLKLDESVVETSDFHAEGDTFAIELGGQVSLIDTGLQANGTLTAAKGDSDDEERKVIPFFIGGSWATPLLLPDYERLIRRGAQGSQNSQTPGSASKSAHTDG